MFGILELGAGGFPEGSKEFPPAPDSVDRYSGNSRGPVGDVLIRYPDLFLFGSLLASGIMSH